MLRSVAGKAVGDLIDQKATVTRHVAEISGQPRLDRLPYTPTDLRLQVAGSGSPRSNTKSVIDRDRDPGRGKCGRHLRQSHQADNHMAAEVRAPSSPK